MEKQGPPPAYDSNCGAAGATTNQPHSQNDESKVYLQQQYGYPGQQPIQQQPGFQGQQGHQQQPYGYQPTTVVMAAHATQFVGPSPNNHSALAWLTCFFCFWPLGLVAVIKSMEVNTAVSQGDMLRARNASENARKFGYAALGFGIFSYIFSVVFLVIYIVVVLPSITKHYD